jgi:C-terminal processing protease CtpA/Prc
MMRIQGLVPICALLLGIWSCRATVGREASDEQSRLTTVDKVYGLSLIWKEASYNFAFFDKVPDLDWDRTYQEFIPEVLATRSDREYYRVLQKFCALLRDGHTSVYPPEYIKQQEERATDKPNIQVRHIQHRAIVVNVGESLKNELPLGSEIVAVDGTATRQHLQRHVFPYLSSSTDHVLWDWGVQNLLKGPAGTEAMIRFCTPEGATGELKVTRDGKMRPEKWVRTTDARREKFRKLQDGIAYMAVDGLENSDLQEIESHASELLASKGVILDLRQNSGGSDGVGQAIIKALSDKPFLTARWKTREHRAAFKAWGQRYSKLTDKQLAKESEWARQMAAHYRGTAWHEAEPETIEPRDGPKIGAPVVVLIGHETASAAENFLVSLDSIGRATFVGQKTSGTTGQPLFLNLPGGGQVRICTKRDYYPDGREYVGYGVSPHVCVEPTVDDILKGKDVVLEKGIEVLRDKIRGSGR